MPFPRKGATWTRKRRRKTSTGDTDGGHGTPLDRTSPSCDRPATITVLVGDNANATVIYLNSIRNSERKEIDGRAAAEKRNGARKSEEEQQGERTEGEEDSSKQIESNRIE